MEKYYIVTEQCPLRDEYLKYCENTEIVNQHVIKFFKDHDIETHEYSPTTDVLYIVPTEKDKEKYKNALSKDIGNGLQSFKKNTKIGKAWIKSLEEKGLTVLSKPYVGFYFTRFSGKFNTRLFNHNGTIYCSMKSEYNFQPHEGLIEIKGSEFHKIMEEITINEGGK